MPSNVFISYSSIDREIASFLADFLREKEIDVFIDYQRLTAGDSFSEQLRRQITQCKYFILVVSERSADSKWVQAEVNLAHSLDKPIIPVMLERVILDHSKLWFINHQEQVDFTSWHLDKNSEAPLKKLLTAISVTSNQEQTETSIEKQHHITVVSPKDWLAEFLILEKFPLVKNLRMLRPVVEGQSGSKVFIVKIDLNDPNSKPQTCFLKIHYAQGNTPLLRHQEAFKTFSHYMPRIVDATPWNPDNNQIALLYTAEKTVDSSIALENLLESRGQQAYRLINNTCEAIWRWNYPLDFERNYKFSPMSELIMRALSHSADEMVQYRRLEDPETSVYARLKMHLGLDETISQLKIAGKREVLPNPLAYIKNPDFWNRLSSTAISWICGHVHGDLNIRNILSLDPRADSLAIIDFDTYDSENLIFIDYFQLELGIILKLLSPRDKKNHAELMRLSDYLASSLVLTDIPDLSVTSMGINTLLRPIREKLATFWQGDEDLIASIWIARMVVGLELSRKKKLHISERILSVLYAADSLNSLLKHLRIDPDEGGSTLSITWKVDDPPKEG